MRHEHAAIDLQADGFSDFDALALTVGTVAIDGNAVDETVGKGGRGK
ncbi:MAG: hypothetical protein GY883_07330 [Shimia sp.]|nr:hypothetical protein [Shimia sp.]